MATVQEVKQQIENANALGVSNLTDKGVEISADATTFDIMTAIAEISGGDSGSGGAEYTNIVYNDDNTITLTDTEGIEHTIECEYADGKLVSVNYNGTSVALEYDGDMLVSIDGVAIDMSNMPSSGGTEELEELIDNSGVLDSTDGTATKKVEQLIDKANSLEAFECIVDANTLFYGVKSFPKKAVVNLPNAYRVFQAFADWKESSIPMVEEIIVNVPNILVNNNQTCMGQMFSANKCVKKVVLNMPDGCQYMVNTFNYANNLEEVVLNFSTKNIIEYENAFNECTKLKKIIGVLDFSSAKNVKTMFWNCANLEEVTFEPNTLSVAMAFARSTKLTSESTQSIIDGLATVETAQTLTLNSAIVLTDEQKATINAKGWTLAQ